MVTTFDPRVRTDAARAGDIAPGIRHERAGTAPRPAVTVRVLGPVDVVGAVRPFRRAWTLDLVVYLAMHPRGVSGDAWAGALWPERLAAAPTRHSTVSAARRALGRAADGRDLLPHGRGVLRLEPDVVTDWAQLCDLASGRSGPGGAASWSAALDLVRGRPFDGLRSYDWAVLDGWVSQVEDGVVQLALRLAEHHLAAGDGRGAELAARRALTASPFDERLYRVLLRAADQQGNPAGVEAAMSQLVGLLAGEAGDEARPGRRTRFGGEDRLDLVHPETAALYRALSRRARTRRSPPPSPVAPGRPSPAGRGRGPVTGE